MASHKRVIILDRDSAFLRVWERVFRLMDRFDYTITNDPKAALALVKEKGIALLISEVIMDGCNGFDIAEELHKNNPGSQVILTTSYDCDLRRFKLDHPKFHILYKPYQRIEDVIHFVEDILNRKDPRIDADEESWSENEAYPTVMEWKL